jgi:hypothetical protein
LGSFFGRRPTRTHTELEHWIGATSGLAPSAGLSEYLFSGIAPPGSIELVTAPRWLIVLGASSSILVLAIAWIYVPGTRRVWVLVPLACLLAALAVAFPAPAALLGQASVLGLALAMIAIWIARFAAGPAQRAPLVTGGSTQRLVTPRPELPSPSSSKASSKASSKTPAGTSSATVLRAGESNR